MVVARYKNMSELVNKWKSAPIAGEPHSPNEAYVHQHK